MQTDNPPAAADPSPRHFARQPIFNIDFAHTLNMMGFLPDYSHLQGALQSLWRPRVRSRPAAVALDPFAFGAASEDVAVYAPRVATPMSNLLPLPLLVLKI